MIHVCPSSRVKTNVGRIPLLVSLILPLAAADSSSLNRTLKGVEERYNRAQTLEIGFSEAYSAQGKTRKPESGTLYLRKPGRMRWQYSTPAGKLILSDGKFFYIILPDTARVQKMKTRESEDMRAPLAFLLGRLHFEKDFQNFQSKPAGEDTIIDAEPKSPDLPYSHVEFEVTPEFEIRRVIVTGQDHSVFDFHFDHEKLNPLLDAKLFRFTAPPGAIVEETLN